MNWTEKKIRLDKQKEINHYYEYRLNEQMFSPDELIKIKRNKLAQKHLFLNKPTSLSCIGFTNLVKMKLPKLSEFLFKREFRDSNMNLLCNSVVVGIQVHNNLLNNINIKDCITIRSGEMSHPNSLFYSHYYFFFYRLTQTSTTT